MYLAFRSCPFNLIFIQSLFSELTLYKGAVWDMYVQWQVKFRLPKLNLMSDFEISLLSVFSSFSKVP